MAAPTATPVSPREKLKLTSTVTAMAAYTAAPPSSGVGTTWTLRADGVSRAPSAKATRRTIGAAKNAGAQAWAARYAQPKPVAANHARTVGRNRSTTRV